MKGIYLASFKALHENHNIIYQDINGERDIGGDMMNVDLTPYDYIIATPPCNWWSRANYRRDSSQYALETKHLLIDILDKLVKLGKPFIVENVKKNSKQFIRYGLFSKGCIVKLIGRHTYWTNINFKSDDIIQEPVVDYKDGKKRWLSSQHLARKDRQGGEEVHEVIERFIQEVEKGESL